MRGRRPPVLALMLAGLPAVAAAQAPAPAPAPAPVPTEEMPPPEQFALRVEYREYRPSLTGDIRRSSGGEIGTLIDLEDDLGLEDERTFEIRGTIQFKLGSRLRFSYTPIEYSGDVSAPRNLRFGGVEIDAGDRVATSVKGGYYAGAFEWDFMKGPHGYAGAQIGLKFFDIDSVLVDVDSNQRETNTARAPIPILGITGRFYAGSRVSIEGELSGLTLGSRGALWEFDTSLRIHLSDRLALQGGYRRLSLRAEDGDDEGDMLLSGWTFGLELSL